MPGDSAFGSQVQLSIASVLTTITRVPTMSGPKLKRDTKDVSAHDSPGQWMEKIATMKDGGEVTFDINYDDDGVTHMALLDAFDSGDLTAARVQFPSGRYFGFDSYVTGFEPSAPHDDKLSASVTLTVSGEVDFPA